MTATQHQHVTVNVLVRAGTARVLASAAAPEVRVTSKADSVVPGLDLSLTENQWDLATFGFGLGIGLAVGHLPGAFVGGVSSYAWGRWRSRQVNEK